MLRVVRRSAAVLSVLFLFPAAALAQGAITGVVKDVSGGVLPGVTVEVASPVLIEKVRSVSTDATGQYRVVDLRPGAYSVTFSLTGFKTVKRDGIQLTGTFVATVSADLAVGGLDETITVTGQSPIVDVQSVRVQQTMSDDVIAAIPSSRNAAGLQSLIPGLNVSQAGVAVGGGDAGGITGGMGGLAGTIHGGNTYGSRTKTDGLNTDFTGQATAGGQLLNTAGASEVVINTSGGLGEAEGAGVNLNIIPKDGGNTFRGSAFGNTAKGWMQASNFTESLKAQGLRTPAELKNLYDVDGQVGGPIVRDKLWFYFTVRQVVSNNTVPGMWVNKNANNPNLWVCGFRPVAAGLHRHAGPERSAASHVAGVAAPQADLLLAGAAQLHRQGRRRHADADARGHGLDQFHAVPRPAGHLDVCDQQQAAGGGRDRDVPRRLRSERRWRTAHRRDRRREQPG